MLATFFATVAVVTGLARAWPQFLVIVVRSRTDGVSTTSWVLALITSVAWEGIGLAEGIGVTIAFNLLTALSAAAVLAGLVRHHQFSWRGFALTLLGSIAGTYVSYWIAGSLGVAILGNALALIMFFPQLVHIVRHSAEGVSLGTWILSAVTQTSWAVYGALIHEPVLIWVNFVMVPCALVICWRIAQFQRLDARSKLATSAL